MRIERAEILNRAIKLAVDESLSKGITTFQDAGSPTATVDVLKRLADRHELRIRIWMMLRESNASLAAKLDQYKIIGAGGNFLTVRAIKRAIDGALGPRGAWLLEPYADKPDSSGLNTDDPADIRQTAELAIKHGFQLCVHAIGDRSNRTVLDEFEQALKEVPVAEHRFRIEHAQIIHPDDIPRFAELGVIPSMQASHQTSDMYWAANRLGNTRVLGAYAWRSLLNTGVIIPNGSDFPVEQVNPLISFHSAVARQDARNFGIPEAVITNSGFLDEKSTDGGNRRIFLGLRYTF